MLSGHAPLNELGMGSFQEMRQAEMAAPVVKEAWTAERAENLADDIARALQIATAGSPGPVHVSLPVDLLDAHVPAPRGLQADAPARDPLVFRAPPRVLDDALVQRASALLAAARRPLILAGPVMSNGRASDIREELTNALGIPALCMESPRGLNDPALGALAEVVSRADFVVLLGKRTDFTLRFAQAPAFAESCRFVVIDPERAALERTLEVIGPARMALSAIADTVPAARQLCAAASVGLHDENWKNEVESAVRYRPPEWSQLDSGDGPVHPAEVGRAVQHFLQTCREPLFVSDGGEFGQWAQACIDAPTRIINGPAGSIGSAIPFALAAKLARPQATVVATTGDGACGFHLLELETALRTGLAPIVVVGNDACWNAEHQIQIRAYGEARARYTELSPTRYDQIAVALDAHGELVTRARDLGPALERARGSGRAALLNVMTQRAPAPVVRRS
jgi:acetolactate synthase-1/2/3 large subunit